MVQNTILPKRNSMIVIIYSLLILFMFFFLSAVLYFHLPQQKTNVHAELTDNTVVQQPQKIVLGKYYSLPLSGQYKVLLNHAWEDFYQDKNINRLAHPKNEKEVYQIYSNYNAAENKVDILIGYLVDKTQKVSSPYDVLTLASGKYLKTQSVLDTWYQAQANKPAVNINYQYDYEQIQLDEQYAIHSQTAYLSVE